jgi:hypothetical protein
MPSMLVKNKGTGGSVLVYLDNVVGTAEVYSAADTLTQGGSMVKRLTDVGNGQHTISGLVDGVWYLFFVTDGLGLEPHYERARPTNKLPYYSLDVLREAVDPPYVIGREFAYRMEARAINPERMTTKVFLYERQPFNAFSQDERDVFVSVCSPGDLEEYPEDAPSGITDGQQFFRKDSVDLVFRSSEELEQAWAAICTDVQELVYAMNRIRILGRHEICEAYAGDIQDDSSSSSSGQSSAGSSETPSSESSKSSEELSSSSSSSLSSLSSP